MTPQQLGKSKSNILAMQAMVNQRMDSLFPEPVRIVIISKNVSTEVIHYIDPVSKLAVAEERKL